MSNKSTVSNPKAYCKPNCKLCYIHIWWVQKAQGFSHQRRIFEHCCSVDGGANISFFYICKFRIFAAVCWICKHHSHHHFTFLHITGIFAPTSTRCLLEGGEALCSLFLYVGKKILHFLVLAVLWGGSIALYTWFANTIVIIVIFLHILLFCSCLGRESLGRRK